MSTAELERSRTIAASGGRLRLGCWACDFVGDLTRITGATGEGIPPDARPSEAQIHGFSCPECRQVGGMHEYPTAGTWPSDYAENECPVAPDGAVSE